jgi:bifunctional non-homologous end joining protein LigD
MLASIATEVPAGDDWTFEPKYDGIRVLAFVDKDAVSLTTRNGIDKARQFPEVVEALAKVVARTREPFVLDGEIVARDGEKLGRFQALQGRVHEQDETTIAGSAQTKPAVLVAFDLLLRGKTSLVNEPWTARREALEALLKKPLPDALQLGDSWRGDGPALLDKARKNGWEGILAKRVDAPYALGARSRDWRKLKVEARQEFVVGGWTEPRRSRAHIGAILLGYWDGDRLVYAGHTGAGFTHQGLADMYALLHRRERKTSPFAETPRTNEQAHWTRPDVVVEVKFNEWTNDGRLRQPVFLGARDDKDPGDVRREAASMQRARKSASRLTRVKTKISAPARAKSSSRSNGRTTTAVADQLSAIESDGGAGSVNVGKGIALDVSNLAKTYFPKARKTKGDLMRYYATVAPALLPQITDRPLILKRFPDGATGPSFFQQRAPDDAPEGVRIEPIASGTGESIARFVGGDLATLLFCAQLGAIDVNPWHSRAGSLEFADYSIIDLDPGARVPFRRVVEVARWAKEALDEAGLHGALKTSGSTGMHVYLPLPPDTPTTRRCSSHR